MDDASLPSNFWRREGGKIKILRIEGTFCTADQLDAKNYALRSWLSSLASSRRSERTLHTLQRCLATQIIGVIFIRVFSLQSCLGGRIFWITTDASPHFSVRKLSFVLCCMYAGTFLSVIWLVCCVHVTCTHLTLPRICSRALRTSISFGFVLLFPAGKRRKEVNFCGN